MQADLNHLRQTLSSVILDQLPEDHEIPELREFYKLIRDYPERGGKLLRGLFVLLSTEAHGGSWQRALPVAAALELFQNWVLIHDDIEDGSIERRGKPALHQTVGMPIALNVGDALHVYMWQGLGEIYQTLPRAKAIHEEFFSTIHRTAEGQHLELSWIKNNRFDFSEAQYLDMVSLKTAYYTVIAPLRLGALCADKTPDSRLKQAGQNLGVAFQIRDDVLNLLEDHDYGKEFAGDLYEAKRTLILARLFSCATKEEQSTLSQKLAKPRSLRTEEDIAYTLRLLSTYHVLDYAQKIADEKAKTGLDLLREVARNLPNQTVTHKLTGLLETLASRRS